MLIECPECKREVSDWAASCPHCGHPLAIQTPAINGAEAAPALPALRGGRAPIFTVLGAGSLVITLATPRILVFMPLLIMLLCCIVGIFRRENGRVVNYGIIALGLGLLVMVSSPDNGVMLGSNTLGGGVVSADTAEIKSWNWRADPTFGDKGTIRWNVEVLNKSTRNIRNAKVEFTTYDAMGKLVATTFTFVDAIPSGQSRAANSFADYYGTEKTATVKISEVYFAN